MLQLTVPFIALGPRHLVM